MYVCIILFLGASLESCRPERKCSSGQVLVRYGLDVREVVYNGQSRLWAFVVLSVYLQVGDGDAECNWLTAEDISTNERDPASSLTKPQGLKRSIS